MRATNFSLPTNLSYTGTAVSGGSAIPGRLTQRTFDGTVLGDEAAPTDTSDWSAVVGVIAADGVTYRITTGRRIEVSTDGSTWTLLTSWTDGRLADHHRGDLRQRSHLLHGLRRQPPLRGRLRRGERSREHPPGPGRQRRRGRPGLERCAGPDLRRREAARHRAPTGSSPAPRPGRPPAGARLARAAERPGRRRPRLVVGVGRCTPVAAAAPPPVEPPPLVDEHFDLGLDAWTNMVGFTIDPTNGGPSGAAPSAKADVTGTRASGSRRPSPRPPPRGVRRRSRST